MKTTNRWLGLVAGFSVTAGTTAHVVRAEYVSDANNVLPPRYHSTDTATFATPGGNWAIDSFFDITYRIDFAGAPLPAEGSPPSFFDVFTDIDLNLAGPVGPFQIRESPTRQSLRLGRLNGLPPGTPVIDTEMLQLDLSGGTLPPNVRIRESPTLQSVGRISMTDIGGGHYSIDSFFDVFTELSIDGGETWTPADGALRFTGVPEPASLVLACAGGLALCRRGPHRRRQG